MMEARHALLGGECNLLVSAYIALRGGCSAAARLVVIFSERRLSYHLVARDILTFRKNALGWKNYLGIYSGVISLVIYEFCVKLLG